MVSKSKRVEVIRTTPLFSQLSDRECEKLAPVFKERALTDGEALCRQGDTGDYLAVVVDGTLNIEVEGGDGKQTVVSQRSTGQAVGEMACVDPSPRSATVRADGPATVLILSRTMLDSLKSNASSLFSRVLRGIAYRLAEMLDDTNALISEMLDASTLSDKPHSQDLDALQQQRSGGEPVNALKEGLELSSEAVLKGFDDEERRMLRTATDARRYGLGEVLCLQGEPASEAFFVAEGEVEVLRRIGGKNYRMAEISTGGFLGQRALLRQGTRGATLRAGSRGTTVFCLSRERFNALLEADTDFAIAFQEAVTTAGIRQLRLANDMASHLGTRGRQRASEAVKRRIQQQADPGEAVDSPIGDDEPELFDDDDDVESLASAYLQTALENWDVTPSEIDGVKVAKADGEMSSLEKKMRNQRGDD